MSSENNFRTFLNTCHRALSCANNELYGYKANPGGKSPHSTAALLKDLMMIGVLVLLTVLLTPCVTYDDKDVLIVPNGSQFLIYNKLSPAKAHLKAEESKEYKGKETKAVVGYESNDLALDQLWTMDAHPDIKKKGYYYVVNGAYPKYRLDVLAKKLVAVAHTGPFTDSQLFRFETSRFSGYYFITSYSYPNDRMYTYKSKSGSGYLVSLVTDHNRKYHNSKLNTPFAIMVGSYHNSKCICYYGRILP